MNKKELKNKYIIAIILACLINVILLLIWFFISLMPILNKIENIEDKVTNIEIASNYESYNSLENTLNNISKEYSLIFSVEDRNGKILTDDYSENNISLFDKLVNINDNTYLVKAYSTQTISLTRVFIKLFVFEIIVVIIIMGLIFLFTRQTIFIPIDKIINDIRNYKLGRKPVKSKNKNVFGTIKNEFVKLTNLVDEEKKEQTRIIASINHDIKTPLTSIIGYSDLLMDKKIKTDEVVKYASKIHEKSMHIKDILATFDDYLLNHEKVTLDKNNILIKDLIDDLYNDYKIELENKNIKFQIECLIKDKNINIDFLKIKRVFANIVTNSIRYLKNDGKISIKITEDENNIIFLIKDNGPGVDEKIIDKIFDPLFTTDSSRKISGLGLSICKEFIEMHNGEIKAYNDKGLIIEFTIPKEN